MPPRFDTIALTGNWRDPRVVESIDGLAAHLAERGLALRVGAGYPGAVPPAPVVDEELLAADSALLVAVGGDGTMLHAARRAAAAGVPLLGINRGRLGFLADVSPAEMLAVVDAVLAGDFKRDRRALLRAQLVDGDRIRDCGLALNDVVVKRLDSGRMFDFDTFVDGVYVNTHGGDGFIVATPTGSTAYALSCGGPILTPEIRALVLAPICPHTLSDRPIVIPGDSVTEIALYAKDGDVAAVCCDGEVRGELGAGTRLRVAAAPEPVELVHPLDHDFFAILRNKLHWGRGKRSGSH